MVNLLSSLLRPASSANASIAAVVMLGLLIIAMVLEAVVMSRRSR
jgi:hypothetical protein